MMSALRRLLSSRQGGTLLLALLYLSLSAVLRAGLLVASHASVSWGPATVAAFLTGFGFDLVMVWLLTLPYAIFSAFWPSRFGRVVPLAGWFFHAFLFTLWAVSAVLFWDEFGVRFNFIAVDYLVYTTEVVANINESYPMPLILSAVAAFSALAYWFFRRRGWTAAWHEASVAGQDRPLLQASLLTLPLALALGASWWVGTRDAGGEGAGAMERVTAGLRHLSGLQPAWENAVDTELGKNGEFAFFAAFWSNRLDWHTFYLSRPDAIGGLRTRLRTLGIDASEGDLRRVVPGSAGRRLNVIQVTVESLSAKYLGCYGVNDPEDRVDYSRRGLTPNLDRISGESLWFSRLYAGGTRTVRGMEALTLSYPPIPGQSVLRRQGCENMSTLGSALARNGYDCRFIYGGNGFFDNMDYFFGKNGYRVLDRPAAEEQGLPVSFANAWGACDEDAFAWSMAEADRCHAAGRPFHHFVMTTSNHRPFTWPAGTIDPRFQGREGGVAYTDYAIGRFIEKARARPWFKDTVFVFVADHCALVAGHRELEVKKYEIPLFVWSPANIPPKKVDVMMSQIDLAPTLLGLLGLPYGERFLGCDVLSASYRPRAFISNYQKVALLRGDGTLTVLKPTRQVSQYRTDLATGELRPLGVRDEDAVTEAIDYYQGAYELFEQHRLGTLR
jgi:phosphoglycerol transferase MdoB-like AlkP superfamily enzyme